MVQKMNDSQPLMKSCIGGATRRLGMGNEVMGRRERCEWMAIKKPSSVGDTVKRISCQAAVYEIVNLNF